MYSQLASFFRQKENKRVFDFDGLRLQASVMRAWNFYLSSTTVCILRLTHSWGRCHFLFSTPVSCVCHAKHARKPFYDFNRFNIFHGKCSIMREQQFSNLQVLDRIRWNPPVFRWLLLISSRSRGVPQRPSNPFLRMPLII